MNTSTQELDQAAASVLAMVEKAKLDGFESVTVDYKLAMQFAEAKAGECEVRSAAVGPHTLLCEVDGIRVFMDTTGF